MEQTLIIELGRLYVSINDTLDALEDGDDVEAVQLFDQVQDRLNHLRHWFNN